MVAGASLISWVKPEALTIELSSSTFCDMALELKRPMAQTDRHIFFHFSPFVKY